MDYLREIALRQAALLERLLTGETVSEERPAEMRRTGARPLQTAEREAETSRFPEKMAEGSAETAARREMTRGETDRRGGAVPAAGPTMPERMEGEWPSPDGLDAAAETFFQQRQADTVWRSAAAQSGLWMEPVSVWQEKALDAAALSRAVQRDARRYDGGFTMY